MSALILSRSDLTQLLTPADYLTAVETGFRLNRVGLSTAPAPMHIEGVGGAFHAKGASFMEARKLVALKFNANFPQNPARGLPTIQGLILLHDAETGEVLAVMDSIEITLRRTAAASALAARYLAKPDAASLAIIGCGAQAPAHVDALIDIFPIRRIRFWDIDATKCTGLADAISAERGIDAAPAASYAQATRESAIIVTCTTARRAFLSPDDVSPGAFVAAVGADHPQKSEITPHLMRRATVIADSLEQCAVMGDLHHAMDAGEMTIADIAAELADIVMGANPGRRRDDEIIIYDSTGAAFQDAASAAFAYARAKAGGRGFAFSFAH